jgi:RHS repeat-associated protein
MKKFSNGTPVSDTRYVRAGFLPMQERDGSNNVIRQYTWGLNYGGGISGLLNLNQGGVNYSYLYDGKGNITNVLDNSQNIVASYIYDPFGQRMSKTGILDQPYMFSTKEYDAETGLSYYGYRYYYPSNGKWMTRDPLGELSDINLYRFVGNNPNNATDPEGLDWRPDPRGGMRPHRHHGPDGPVEIVNPNDPGAWPGDPSYTGEKECKSSCNWSKMSECLLEVAATSWSEAGSCVLICGTAIATKQPRFIGACAICAAGGGFYAWDCYRKACE